MKRQLTDLNSENLTDSILERNEVDRRSLSFSVVFSKFPGRNFIK